RPSDRIPVPASRIIISLSARNSTQVVLPPYRRVPGPGTGIDPRTPQNFRRAGDFGAVAMDEGAGFSHATPAKPRVFGVQTSPYLGGQNSKLEPRNSFEASPDNKKATALPRSGPFGKKENL